METIKTNVNYSYQILANLDHQINYRNKIVTIHNFKNAINDLAHWERQLQVNDLDIMQINQIFTDGIFNQLFTTDAVIDLITHIKHQRNKNKLYQSAIDQINQDWTSHVTHIEDELWYQIDTQQLKYVIETNLFSAVKPVTYRDIFQQFAKYVTKINQKG